MSENTHGHQEVPKESKTPEEVYVFAQSLFNRLHPKQLTQSEEGTWPQVTKSKIDLPDGSELEVRYQSHLELEKGKEEDWVSLIHRKHNPRTGKVEDFLYDINASAVQAKMRGQDYDPFDLTIGMNQTALDQFQISAKEAIAANIPHAEVLMANIEHQDIHYAAAEVEVARLLSEARHQPDHSWYVKAA